MSTLLEDIPAIPKLDTTGMDASAKAAAGEIERKLMALRSHVEQFEAARERAEAALKMENDARDRREALKRDLNEEGDADERYRINQEFFDTEKKIRPLLISAHKDAQQAIDRYDAILDNLTAQIRGSTALHSKINLGKVETAAQIMGANVQNKGNVPPVPVTENTGRALIDVLKELTSAFGEVPETSPGTVH